MAVAIALLLAGAAVPRMIRARAPDIPKGGHVISEKGATQRVV
jgi:hypothetical protein